MKKILIILLLSISISTVGKSQANVLEINANKIANKMKDSLVLTNSQRDSIFAATLMLQNRKMQVRQQFQNRDSVTWHIQHIERQRDSLYMPFLNQQQFLLYKQKKPSLLSTN